MTKGHPFGDFSNPDTMGQQGLEFFVRSWIGNMKAWRGNNDDYANCFSYYIERAFERAQKLGLDLSPSTPLGRLKEEYKRI